MAATLMTLECLLNKAFQQGNAFGSAFAVYLCLYKSSFRPTPLNGLQDYLDNECVYDGYVRGVIPPGGGLLALGTVGWKLVSGTTVIFAWNGPPSPRVTDVAGGAFLLVEPTLTIPPNYQIGPVFPFDNPVVFGSLFQGLPFNPFIEVTS